MQRAIEKTLQHWKNNPNRRPLLLRGARQVGKSTTVAQFGQQAFKHVVTINFEQQPELKSCFDTFQPKEITEAVALATGHDIEAGKTLLFLDEIQDCPRAIVAMRYFYEQMPELHVIGAGSLLEFTLNANDFRMPVGRIEFLYMHPMSFDEFLIALNEEKLCSAIKQVLQKPLPEAAHTKALSFLQKYLLLGGMPAVIHSYITTGKINASLKIQRDLITAYQADFSKYASSSEIKHLQALFNKTPKLVGNKFKYSHVDPETQSRELKHALSLLEMAGILKRIYAASGNGLPITADANERTFKTIFLDVGLMQNICGLQRQLNSSANIMGIHKGAIAEQLIGQELIANQSFEQPAQLHYWVREARNSSAEVDYLLSIDNEPTPIEVKAGKGSALKSLQLFRAQYGPKKSLRFYTGNTIIDGHLISLPLYAVSAIKDWL